MVVRWEAGLRVSGWSSDYQAVNNLFRYLKNRKTGSEASRAIYGFTLYAFCLHTKKLPDELVSMKKAEIEKLVEDFCYRKKERGCSARTVNTNLFMLKSFFKVNGFKGNEKLEVESYYQPSRARTRAEYIPTLEEATRMANVAGSLRDRAMILFMLSTGLRNSAIRAVLYGEVKEELDKGTENILIRVHAGMKGVVSSACKGNIEYSIFTSREATEAIRLYIGERRRRRGEIQDKELLFCSEHNRLPLRQRGSKPLTSRELQIIVKETARKAGIKEWMNVVPHCLRKTFESVLRSQFIDGGRLDLKTQEYFMGHILGGSMDTYFDKTKVDELRKEYAKLIFKPREQVGVEVLDSLQGMAKVLGVDVARLEESRKKELGRALNDAEKLIITQEAIKQAVTEFKNAVESNAKTTLVAGSGKKLTGEQDLTGKNQITTSEDGTTHDGFLSPRISLSKPASAVISPPQQAYIPIKRNLKVASIQLNLDMIPQESSTRSKQATNKRPPSELGCTGDSNLLQFSKDAS